MSDQIQSGTNNSKPAAAPYHYKICGLDYVYLLNGVVRESTDYGDSTAIKNAIELHREIGLFTALCQSELNGAEVKFLRKEMDLTQEELATELGVTGQTVARYEKGETDIPGPVDRLLRALYVLRVWPQNERAPILERTLAAQERLPNGGEISRPPIYFYWTDAGWRRAESSSGKFEILDRQRVLKNAADETSNVRAFPGVGAKARSRARTPGRLAPGDKVKLAADGAASPPPTRLGLLRFTDAGVSLEFWSDDAVVYAHLVYARLRGRRRFSAVQLGSKHHALTASKRYFGWLNVENLSPEHARDFIRLHEDAPDRYPVLIK